MLPRFGEDFALKKIVACTRCTEPLRRGSLSLIDEIFLRETGFIVMLLSTSRFNFSVRDSSSGEIALFNAFSGALIKLFGEDAPRLAVLLLEEDHLFEDGALEGSLRDQLVEGTFVHPPHDKQMATIKKRYANARVSTPAVVTITTTMDCNLGCYYCYEERSGARLTEANIEDILLRISKLIDGRRLSALHVDWYGGEPLLNLGFLEIASLAIRELCKERGVAYVASVISNGTEWPEDVVDFIERNAIRQVQISFDGMTNNHDKRRRYRQGRAAPGASSFAKAVDLVNVLVTCTRVDLRFNIDRKNQEDLLPFIEFAERQGWFSGPFPAVFQPARLASYSRSSAFMRGYELSLDEFDVLRCVVRERLRSVALVEESEVPDGFPYPRSSVCAALSSNAFVTGADGLLYRCGLQVGEEGRAVGYIDEREQTFPDSVWWEAFDPTELPTCGICSFLPVCWGGCPKKHLERDEHALHEQSLYWRANLPRLIAERAGFVTFQPTFFTEREQFGTRRGHRESKRIELVLVDADGRCVPPPQGDVEQGA